MTYTIPERYHVDRQFFHINEPNLMRCELSTFHISAVYRLEVFVLFDCV